MGWAEVKKALSKTSEETMKEVLNGQDYSQEMKDLARELLEKKRKGEDK